jgi:hypothetical protein
VRGARTNVQARIGVNGTHLTATALADMYLNPWNVTMTHLVRVEIEFEGSLELSMRGRKVVGDFKIAELNVTVRLGRAHSCR